MLHRALTMGITWCALGKLASAQLPGVAIDPHIVVLSPRHPSGHVTIFNPRATAAEFSISLRFGRITTDSAGHAMVQLTTDSIPRPTSAANWVTPYPAKFILNPGASQTVRLTAKPPTTLPDGEYWARLIVRSRELVTPLTPRHTNDSSVRVTLSLEMSTIIPLFYRKGTLTTGITIDSLSATHTPNALLIHTSLHRTGNSAFLGVANLTITDSAGTTIAKTSKRLAVYDSLSPQWSIPLPPTPHPNVYRLTMTLTTERPDIPKTTVIHAPAVGRAIEALIW